MTIPVFNDTVERLEKDIEEARYIVDSTTAKKYEWAMESGTLSLDEVGGDIKINIADKETLDAVKEKVDLIHTNTEGLSGKIGETNDSGGSEVAGSVFAKLNKIIGDTAGTATLFGQVKDILEKMPTGAVKSVQRGYQIPPSSGGSASGQDITIDISEVNPEKSFVNLYPVKYGVGSGSTGIKLKSLTANKLTVNVIGDGLPFSWEVVELL